MKTIDVENNAQRLWFSCSSTYVAKNERLQELVGAYSCPLFAKLIFWIKDLLSRGSETRKVHDLALKTLQEMQTLMKPEEPRFVFNGDQRYGMYRGCPVLGHSYRELAEKLLTKHSLKKYADIREEAQKVIVQFDALPLFNKYPPLEKERIINAAIAFERPDAGPTFTDKELRQMQTEKINWLAKKV